MYTPDQIEVVHSKDGTDSALITKDKKFVTQPIDDKTDYQYWYRIDEGNTNVRTTTRVWNNAGYDYVFACKGGIDSACKKLNEHLV